MAHPPAMSSTDNIARFLDLLRRDPALAAQARLRPHEDAHTHAERLAAFSHQTHAPFSPHDFLDATAPDSTVLRVDDFALVTGGVYQWPAAPK